MLRSGLAIGLSLFVNGVLLGQAPQEVGKSLLFHATFDKSPKADFAKGDAQIYTAESLKREKTQSGLAIKAVTLSRDQGRFGGALTFHEKSRQVVFFRGANNLPVTGANFQGTISFWLQLSPEKDLPPGFVDPLQVTDKKWNDASFFVDFTKENPRDFRLGAFSNFAFWNPDNRKWDDVPESERPLVTVKKLPFRSDKWTHVAMVFRDFNMPRRAGVATLYLDGKSHGSIERPQKFTWDAQRLAILLGINYVGKMDDLAVFDRALSAAEIKQLFQLDGGVASLYRDR